jgi:glycosyltransferase involved in cell wall biosynthesis
VFVDAGFDPKRIVVKPNFVPEASERRQQGPGGGFLYAGRLTEAKGVTVLMQAWDLLAADGLHPQLTIVGSGPLETEVRRFATRDRSVRVLPPVPPSECYSLIRGARAVLAPSTWEETFGLVVAEAMMLGRPAIASAIGSFPTIVSDNVDGLLVPPGDAAALARAVSKLYAGPGLADRLGTSARATYERRFREAPNLAILESVYDRLVNRIPG